MDSDDKAIRRMVRGLKAASECRTNQVFRIHFLMQMYPHENWLQTRKSRRRRPHFSSVRHASTSPGKLPVTGDTSDNEHGLPVFNSRKTYCTASPREHKPRATSSHRDRFASPSPKQPTRIVSNSPVTHTLPRSVHLSSITSSSNFRRVVSTDQSPPGVHVYDDLLLRFIATILSMAHLGLLLRCVCSLVLD